MDGYVYNPNCQCGRCRGKGIMGPAIMVTVGILFLLDNFGSGWANFHHTWPVILLVIGVVKIIQGSAPCSEHVQPYANMPSPPVNPPAPPVNEGSNG